jgi:Winged helix-turn helix
VQQILGKEVTTQQAAERLAVRESTICRYLRRFKEQGPEALCDHRHSNYRKISETDGAEDQGSWGDQCQALVICFSISLNQPRSGSEA